MWYNYFFLRNNSTVPTQEHSFDMCSRTDPSKSNRSNHLTHQCTQSSFRSIPFRQTLECNSYTLWCSCWQPSHYMEYTYRYSCWSILSWGRNIAACWELKHTSWTHSHMYSRTFSWNKCHKQRCMQVSLAYTAMNPWWANMHCIQFGNCSGRVGSSGKQKRIPTVLLLSIGFSSYYYNKFNY